jgi:hypothetical protein
MRSANPPANQVAFDSLEVQRHSFLHPLLQAYNEEELLWHGADTTTVSNGTAAPPPMEF